MRLAYYRIIMPMQKLAEKYPDDVEIRFNSNPLGIDPETRKQSEDWTPADFEWADIVFTQNIHNFGGMYTMNLLKTAAEHGCFTHFDTDDLLTDLYEGHRLYDVYKEHKLDEVTKFIYNNVDLVTVTQRKFAERIMPFVRNALVVIKNAIDFELPCWNVPRTTAKPVRVGWVGGIHHDVDVKQFAKVPLGVNSRVGVENVHWGFYGRPPVQMKDDGTPDQDWQQDVWDGYEKVMAAGLVGRSKNYGIFPAMPAHDYGKMFSQIDVAVAPLEPNNFNDSKSEIKAIEAGHYGIPLICTDIGCYDEIITNGETGFLIPPDNKYGTWVKTLTKVCKDRKLIKHMGQNLKKIVDENYDINKIIGGRLELYQQLLEAKAKAVEIAVQRQEAHEQGSPLP
jgi:glycosyltransferase involved in cell wall biosynthesis